VRYSAITIAALISLAISFANDDARADEAQATPPSGVVKPPQRHRRDTGSFIAGLVTSIAGGIAMTEGAVFTTIAARDTDKQDLGSAGAILLLGGAIAVLVGVPMASYGGAMRF
jgi:hypothetical protein